MSHEARETGVFGHANVLDLPYLWNAMVVKMVTEDDRFVVKDFHLTARAR